MKAVSTHIDESKDKKKLESRRNPPKWPKSGKKKR